MARLGFVDLIPIENTNTKILHNIENDDPMDIDLIMLENSKDLACVEGKIDNLTIQVLVDSCANISFIPDKVCDEFDLKIDTSKKHKLIGASTNHRSLGMVRNIKIMLAPDCIIEDDFVVISNYPYREIGLSRTCLRRYNYDLHESRKHVALTCDEKDFFIPIIPDKYRCK